MFETQAQAELCIPDLNSKGVRWWDYVMLSVDIPWFHVVYQMKNSSTCPNSKISFLPHVDQFMDLYHDFKFQINQVDLVSPGHLNGTGVWKMEHLNEILVGTEPETDQGQAHIYVMNNKHRYVFSSLTTPEAMLTDKYTIFKKSSE